MSLLRQRILDASEEHGTSPVLAEEAVSVEVDDNTAALRPAPPPPPPPQRDRLPPEVHLKVHRQIIRELGPLLYDDAVEERELEQRLERAGKVVEAPSGFVDGDHVRRVIDKIVSQVGRRIDEASPMVDARLPDGSRVNAVIPPLAIDGPFLTIRKFATDPFTAEDLVQFGTLDQRSVRFLRACIEGRLNIIV